MHRRTRAPRKGRAVLLNLLCCVKEKGLETTRLKSIPRLGPPIVL